MTVFALVAAAGPVSSEEGTAPSSVEYVAGGDFLVGTAFFCPAEETGAGVGGCTVACEGEGELCTIVVEDIVFADVGFSWRCTFDNSIGNSVNFGSATFENVCPKKMVDVTPWIENAVAGTISAFKH